MNPESSFPRPAPPPGAGGDEARAQPDHRAALARLCAFYSELSPDSLSGIVAIYAPAASFKDPFNEVVGVPAIEGIFRAMFDQLDAPRFLIRATVLEGASACVTWEFEFGFRSFGRGQTQLIRGASWLDFDESGRVVRHRDYWDAAEELYEKIPLIGALMRAMRRRLAH